MSGKISESAADEELERIAQQGDLDELNACLKTHLVWIPRRPKRFLDPASLRKEQLLEMIQKDADELNRERFVPWVLELDGKKRLPVFSSKERVQLFGRQITKQLNQVFSLSCARVLLDEIVMQLEVDYIDLNLFSENSREIVLRRRRD